MSTSGTVDLNSGVSTQELIKLCARDSVLFSHTFFPNTCRQAPAPFQRDSWRLLDSAHRLVNLVEFRGSAKTSRLRMYTAKRIAYGVAHTVLYVGKSEGHAIRSVRWLKRQVEYNSRFSQTFALRPGVKWQDVECEIWHGTDEYPVWIMAAGITGTIRGLNQDDFRPDLIVLDDILDDENAATPDQRNKMANLVYGALLNSLTPRSESPDAKMVMANTPQHDEDVAMQALKDPAWVSAVHGCWTPATADLPVDQQESSWPARWSSKELRKEKQDAARRNRLSIFIREMECKITSPETSAFRREWLQYYDLAPETMQVVMAIDPVPPPSEAEIQKGLRKKDFEAFAVVGKYGHKFFLLEYSANRGHEPTWTISEFFRLAIKYRPLMILVEAVAYQRTLQWLLKQAMKHQGRYFAIADFPEKRRKFDRIVDGLSHICSNEQFYVRPEHTDFIDQFTKYPDVANDDIIEAVATAAGYLNNQLLLGDESQAQESLMQQERELPRLEYQRPAP